jgi:hypothetical protein
MRQTRPYRRWRFSLRHAAARLVAEGIIQPPYSICFCLGFRWTLAPDPKTFLHDLHDERNGALRSFGNMNDFTLLATAIGLGHPRAGELRGQHILGAWQKVKRNVEICKAAESCVCCQGVATKEKILGIVRI